VGLAGEREEHDRTGVGVLLGDDGLLDFLGEPAADPGDLVANVLGGRLDVTVEVELEGWNSRVMFEDCSELEEVIVRRPSRDESSSSSTSVTADSITRGLAPLRVVWTETIGGSTSGNSRTDNSRYPGPRTAPGPRSTWSRGRGGELRFLKAS
jgi:hypothetical protein